MLQIAESMVTQMPPHTKLPMNSLSSHHCVMASSPMGKADTWPSCYITCSMLHHIMSTMAIKAVFPHSSNLALASLSLSLSLPPSPPLPQTQLTSTLVPILLFHSALGFFAGGGPSSSVDLWPSSPSPVSSAVPRSTKDEGSKALLAGFGWSLKLTVPLSLSLCKFVGSETLFSLFVSYDNGGWAPGPIPGYWFQPIWLL